MGHRLADFKALMNERDRLFMAELKALRDLMDANLSAMREAVEKAQSAQLGVNATQNEFRGTVQDVLGTMMPRREAESLIAPLASRSQERAGAVAEGRYVYERLVAIVAVVVALAALWLRI